MRWSLTRAVGSLLALVLLSGCWDRTEVNDLAFILTTAIDIEKDGGYRYSVLLPLPGSMGGATGGGGGTAGDRSYYIDSEVGSTFRLAQAKLQRRMSRRMFLAHRRTVLISEAVARAGINGLFDSMPRSAESRMTTYLVVSKGKAYDLLAATPQFERFPSEAIRELLKSRELLQMNMKDVALSISAPGSDPIVVFMGTKASEKGHSNQQEVNVLGYGQFRHDKLVGVFEGQAAEGLSWLRNQGVENTVAINLDGVNIIGQVFNTSNKIKVRVADEKLHFDIHIKTKAKIRESIDTYDFSKTDSSQRVQDKLAAYIKASVEKAILQMKEAQTDSSQFGTYVWRSYPNLWEKRFKADWPHALKTAEFNIAVETILTETGLIYENVTHQRHAP